MFETYRTMGRGVEPMTPGYAGLLDLTPYGRQETWEDSPAAGRSDGDADGSTPGGEPRWDTSR